MDIDEDPRAERARELRRAGRSLRQIREEIGPVGKDRLHSWLRGVPPPEWTRRPQAKDHLRREARELRVKGFGYDEIAARLGVSKSSVSLWVRDLPHPPRDQQRHTDAIRRYWQGEHQRRSVERADRWAASSAEVGALTERELFLIGVALYWAEGAKSKPWERRELLRFINSDPNVVRLFLAWVRGAGVSDDRLRFAVSIHESADVDRAHRYWRDVIGIENPEFRKPVLKHHRPGTVRHNTGDTYYGCLAIYVKKSVAEFQRMEGAWRAIALAAPHFRRA